MLTTRIALVAALMFVGASQSYAQTVKVKEEKSGMLKEAKVSPTAAQKAALSKVPGGTVMSAEIERENGKLIYSYDIKAEGKTGIEEIHVDAMTGAVIAHEHESPDMNNGNGHAKKRKP